MILIKVQILSQQTQNMNYLGKDGPIYFIKKNRRYQI
jgi:hypothetical protein